MHTVSELAPVVPSKGDDVILISGESKGDVASLIGLDGADGIVKMPDHDISIFSMSCLAKYKLPVLNK